MSNAARSPASRWRAATTTVFVFSDRCQVELVAGEPVPALSPEQLRELALSGLIRRTFGSQDECQEVT